MTKQDAFNMWWDGEGQHLPQNNCDIASAAWEACEHAHKSGLVELSLRCNLEGMITENRQREAGSQSPAYNYDSFMCLGKEAWRLAGMGVEMPKNE
jgi:hypothetical protein